MTKVVVTGVSYTEEIIVDGVLHTLVYEHEVDHKFIGDRVGIAVENQPGIPYYDSPDAILKLGMIAAHRMTRQMRLSEEELTWIGTVREMVKHSSYDLDITIGKEVV